jgi:hypothetical protein
MLQIDTKYSAGTIPILWSHDLYTNMKQTKLSCRRCSGPTFSFFLDEVQLMLMSCLQQGIKMPYKVASLLHYIFRVVHFVFCARVIFMATETGAIQQFPISGASLSLLMNGNVSGKIPVHQMSYDVNGLGLLHSGT